MTPHLQNQNITLKSWERLNNEKYGMHDLVTILNFLIKAAHFQNPHYGACEGRKDILCGPDNCTKSE